jgi:brefeldin A-inhibited guanine nucleotide-exchange protein
MTAAICVEEKEVALHGTLLLKAVRIMYNIFLISKSPNVQTVAQATLTQITSTIFNRIPMNYDFLEIVRGHKEKITDGKGKNRAATPANSDIHL